MQNIEAILLVWELLLPLVQPLQTLSKILLAIEFATFPNQQGLLVVCLWTCDAFLSPFLLR